MMHMQLIRHDLNKNDIALMETLFHTANGYLGVRGCLEEGAPEGAATIRGAYINGFYDEKPISYGEKLYGFPETQQTIVNLPDVQTVNVYLGEERFDAFQGELLSHERELDMAAGETVRRARWRGRSGKEIAIEVRRMASFDTKELFVLEYAVTSVDYDGPLAFVSSQNAHVTNFFDPDDPRVAAAPHEFLHTEKTFAEGDFSFIVCRTKTTGLAMVSAVAHDYPAGFSKTRETVPGLMTERFLGHIAPGETARLVKRCVFTDARRHGDPLESARGLLKAAQRTDLADLRASQRACLQKFWAVSRVEISGDDALQECMDYSLYALLQSAGRDGVSNVAAKGLSGEGYEGHTFWDTEIYVFPFFLLTDREEARRLLKYRHDLLDSARAHARLMGHQRGALYPWRTIAGPECSGYFPSGSAQYHINGDIAHAFIQYYLATDDLAFMVDFGAEVLIETARLWLDAGHMSNGTFRIDDVTGPDEYTCIVNNNYYTNAAARENLLFAAEICKRLKKEGLFSPLQKMLSVTETEIREFQEAGERMYLPYDRELGICAQDDSFLQKKRLNLQEIPKDRFPLLLHYHPLFLYRHQVCKQADTVLAHFLFEDLTDKETMARTYDYYEQLTTHDSSLSACVFSIMAARLGRMDKAEAYFRKTAFLDLHNEHKNTKDGLHTANLGGAYLAIAAGFAGLRIKKDGLTLRPRLPAGLKGYGFRFLFRGNLLFCRVQQDICTLSLESGPPVTARVHGEETVLSGTVAVSIPSGEA